ncbi:MAG: T9SS type A sorting domain-containing protein [Cytophagaceae bacterium]
MKTKLLTLMCILISIQAYPTDFFVTNLGAGNWSAPHPAGTFARAISDLDADGTAGPHRIIFQVSGTINEATGNPASYFINKNNVTIDAITQAPGASCGNPTVLFVGPGYNQLSVAGSNVTFNGLIIQRWRILVTGTGFQMYNCMFGTNSAGTAVAGSGNGYYLRLQGSTNSIIGANDCRRNVFAGHTGITNAIELNGSNDVQINGNYFGTNKAGTTLLEYFTSSAITLQGCLRTRISNNVLCGGYTANGALEIESGSNLDLEIRNNKIGVNAAGTYVTGTAGNYGNTGSGIAFLGGSADNTIIDGNVISCNAQNGVTIQTANSNFQITNNIVGLKGNGIQATGEDYGNGHSGIRCFGAAANATNLRIQNNTVCRNGKAARGSSFQAETVGIIMNQNPVTSLNISNNFVGVDVNHNLAGNTFTGIYLFSNGSMGGGNKNNVMIENNVIGDNGETIGAEINSNGISIYSSQNFTIRNNYIGIGTGGQNIGNSANGLELNTNANNFTLSGNNIAYNKGRRTTAEAEACGGILIFSCTNGYIQNNHIHNHPNAGGSFPVPNNGIVVQRGGQMRIGGIAAGEPNIINNNGTHGIFVLEGADYVEMRRNSIYCNAQMGISLNIATDPASVTSKTAGNNSYAVPGPTVTIGAGCNATTGGNITLSGTAPASSIVEIFNNPQQCRTCPASGNRRGEGLVFLYQTTAGAGTWSYGPVAFTGDASVTATGVGGDCNGGFCRTSRFSDCEFCSLPVEWVSFTGKLKHHKVVLNWETAFEQNASHFVVLRSVDGVSYEVIGKVNANGNTKTLSSYIFNDESPLSGVVYYRLLEVDFDGKEQSSEIISVLNPINWQVFVSPNPATDKLKITVANPGDEHFNIKLYNSSGKSLISQTRQFSTETNQELDITELSAGLYILKISNGNFSQNIQVIKQ